MSQRIEKPVAFLEIWAMVNDDGEYVATHDEENLSDLYGDCIGGTPANLRSVKLTLTVPLPRSVEATASSPKTLKRAPPSRSRSRAEFIPRPGGPLRRHPPLFHGARHEDRHRRSSSGHAKDFATCSPSGSMHETAATRSRSPTPSSLRKTAPRSRVFSRDGARRRGARPRNEQARRQGEGRRKRQCLSRCPVFSTAPRFVCLATARHCRNRAATTTDTLVRVALEGFAKQLDDRVAQLDVWLDEVSDGAAFDREADMRAACIEWLRMSK